MPPVYSLTPRLSSNHAAIANASRCCSPISSASCGLVASGCAAHVARKTSSRSQLSHRTYAGSPNCSPDHHHWPLRVPPNRCGRQYHCLKTAAPNGVGGNRSPQEIASAASLLRSPTSATKSATSRHSVGLSVHCEVGTQTAHRHLPF